MASKPKPERLQVTLPLKTHAFLSVLSGKGTHGSSIPDVARTLIEQGIRRAIREGFLSEQDVKSVQGSEESPLSPQSNQN